MESKIISFLERHEISLRDKTILVGVSGGPDSMALLHFLLQLKNEWCFKLIAISIDHQLRGEESEADIEYVKKRCQQWDVPFVAVTVDVKTYQERNKVSTQVAARKLRYEAFYEQMERFNGDYLALGHHADDQVETLLMAVVRTTNLSSLSGIPMTRRFATGEIIRPFLAVTKSEIEEYCKKYHIQPRIDHTNLDTYYTRNYFRKVIVPKLKERHPNLHMTMQQLSETLQEDDRYLQQEAKKVFERVVQLDVKQKKAVLSIEMLKDCPVALQRRVYRLTLDYLYDELPKQLTYIHEQIFLSLLKEPANKVVHFPQKLLIERSYETLLFYFTEHDVSADSFQQEIESVPDRIVLPNGAILSITYSNERPVIKEDVHTYICSLKELSFPLVVRTRKPGDRMQIRGMEGSKKIKDILIDDKIPRQQRKNIFLIEDHNKEIFWLIGVRKGKKYMKEEGPYVLFKYVPVE